MPLIVVNVFYSNNAENFAVCCINLTKTIEITFSTLMHALMQTLPFYLMATIILKLEELSHDKTYEYKL